MFRRYHHNTVQALPFHSPFQLHRCAVKPGHQHTHTHPPVRRITLVAFTGYAGNAISRYIPAGIKSLGYASQVNAGCNRHITVGRSDRIVRRRALLDYCQAAVCLLPFCPGWPPPPAAGPAAAGRRRRAGPGRPGGPAAWPVIGSLPGHRAPAGFGPGSCGRFRIPGSSPVISRCFIPDLRLIRVRFIRPSDHYGIVVLVQQPHRINRALFIQLIHTLHTVTNTVVHTLIKHNTYTESDT